ncbi:hypothetical protein LS73_002865 [Helicobacter muridarum]|uniref:Uncharacterized protein n=1 Tax=Helicobacter muridarum TaxID=216 RepID=A0A099U0R0_9HELI|nr:hypothetical protein [Helicobacter muridarum]TLE00859.1 hypothetical protein LS73_002865 [Helicobacter muridarum]STQ86630.1 Uncharacterised protein [Helicobacter muridarum]
MNSTQSYLYIVCKIKIILFLLFISIAFGGCGLDPDTHNEFYHCLKMSTYGSYYESSPAKKKCFLEFLKKREEILSQACIRGYSLNCEVLAYAYAFTWRCPLNLDFLEDTKYNRIISAIKFFGLVDFGDTEYYDKIIPIMESYASTCTPKSCYLIIKSIEDAHNNCESKWEGFRDLQAKYLNRACDGGIQDACNELGK